MESEIEVTETPNWLGELEAKREKRLKARLGHEAGAGAPCLKCEDKCPGLDLHFWRKCCKICKCSKEEHEVQDDDIYGWAQFQLLGSKPNKTRRKIALPGKKDELELDWAPKGHHETVDKYLKTLPPDQLPVKGSQAAKDRKQLLQKQIPIHDIDPLLCHDLTEDEFKKMNDYVSHVKQNSVGVGQIVSLSNVIRAHLHNLTPAEAAVMASRYPKGLTLSEIVKLQAESRAAALKRPDLARDLKNLSVDEKNRFLQNFVPRKGFSEEVNLEPRVGGKIVDRNYATNTLEGYKAPLNALYSGQLSRGEIGDKNPTFDPVLNEKLFETTNFNPKNTPGVFLPKLPVNQGFYGQKNAPHVGKTGFNPSEGVFDENFAQKCANFDPDNLTVKNIENSRYPSGNPMKNYEITGFNAEKQENHALQSEIDPQINFSEDFKSKTSSKLPNYAPGSLTVNSEVRNPEKVPKTFRDLAFSTYDPSNLKNLPEISEAPKPTGISYENYPAAFNPLNLQRIGNVLHKAKVHDGSNSDELLSDQNLLKKFGFAPDSKNLGGLKEGYEAESFKNNPENLYGENLGDPSAFSNANNKNLNANRQEQFPDRFRGYKGSFPQKTGDKFAKDNPQGLLTFSTNFPSDFARFSGENPAENNLKPSDNPSEAYGGFKDSFNPHSETKSFENLPKTQFNAFPSKMNEISPKKLSEMQPSSLNVTEDHLRPTNVNIGAIYDINYPEIRAALQETDDFCEDYSPDSLREILNNVKLPDCHYCGKAFDENEYAVSIDRADVLFHADCFRCAGCNQNLADNFYFYSKENNNVYCGRDYAKIRGFPRCKACDELIFTKEYCLAENSTFHLKHFCCVECDTPLAGQDYTLEDEMPYCLPCFEQSKASKCSSCQRPIKPHETGCALNGVHFHAVDECFACKACKKPLMNKKLLLRNQRLYCSHDCFNGDTKDR